MRSFDSSRVSSSRFVGVFIGGKSFAPVNLTLAMPLALALSLALSLTGCAAFSSSNSFSESSGSVSESVESFSDSSSSSSGDDAGAFRDELRAYVVAALTREQDPEALRRGVSEVALGHGITDWEAVDGTWLAIHEGLSDESVDLTDEARFDYERALGLPSRLGRSPFKAPVSSIP